MQQSFLQSKSWELFQQAAGFQTARVGGALLIKKPLLFGKSYFYCPLPKCKMIEEIFQRAKNEHVVFLRWDMDRQCSPSIKHFVRKTIDVQPSKTVLVNLRQSEDELLKQMHSKTRYNIRLAEKKGVAVRAVGASEFEVFWKLMSQTIERDGFRGHGKEYYRKMVEVCAEGAGDMFVRLYVAEYEGKVLAAGLFAFYDGTTTYVHGASCNEHRNVMAPYALHWQVMREAKAMGCAQYDLYGIDEKKWPGVTRFKRGFGGMEIARPGTYDVVFKRLWYSVYQLLRRLRHVYS